MKLLKKTFGAYILVALPVFVLSMGGFYFFLKFVITKQVDGSLLQDKHEITEFVNNNKNDVTELYKNISCSYYLKEIPKDSIVVDRSRFVAIYDSVEQEYEPIRELRSTLMIKDENYVIVLQESFVESDSLIYTIASFALVLLIILTLGISLVQVYISKQIWEPFKNTLQKISLFKPGAKEIPDFKKTTITEFTLLNEALSKMVVSINSDFDKQKKFIDNIAHELQTPLAVSSSLLELFIQRVNLNQDTADLIDKMDSTLGSMRNMNMSLLLLSRIENGQFPEIHNVEMEKIVNNYLEIHQDQIDIKRIDVVMNVKNNLIIQMNQYLAEVLIGNLLKNAIRHNNEYGNITIELSNNMIEITNTGEHLETNPERLFDKYIHFGKHESSTGIGLSIVKEICNYYGFEVTYKIIGSMHIIKVFFN